MQNETSDLRQQLESARAGVPFGYTYPAALQQQQERKDGWAGRPDGFFAHFEPQGNYTVPIYAAPQPDGQGATGEQEAEFHEGQWWVQELEALTANGTDDQKRAMAVVRRMLRTTTPRAEQPEPAAPKPSLRGRHDP